MINAVQLPSAPPMKPLENTEFSRGAFLFATHFSTHFFSGFSGGFKNSGKYGINYAGRAMAVAFDFVAVDCERVHAGRMAYDRLDELKGQIGAVDGNESMAQLMKRKVHVVLLTP